MVSTDKEASNAAPREEHAPTSDVAEAPSVPVTEDLGYTSVIYVHGIGRQRRYEETSRLIDSLDRYSFKEHENNASKGKLSNIKVRVEPLRSAGRDDKVGYIRAIFSRGSNTRRTTIRFYELYWAPILADIKSPWGVLRWLFRQALRPRQTAFSPWRERQRLRRASLVSLFEPGQPPLDGIEVRDYGQMLKLYNDFEGLVAQRNFPLGSYKDFLAFLTSKESKNPDRLRRHLRLARIWRRTYVLEEARNALALTTLALALVLLAGGALVGTFTLLEALVAALSRYSIVWEVGWKTAATTLVSLAGLLGLGKILTDYLGDVEAWATYEETDVKHEARKKVLDQSVELLTHVLNDPKCRRVVIVAHSLGTSIAHDAILELTRCNLAQDAENAMSARVRLDKIDQFVTMGSPIDKIEYFFEGYASASHRYKRVVEALRGDIGSAPFSDRDIPQIHWINFWDEGDPISGPLQSPAGSSHYLQRVDNVRVANLSFPAPGGSHAGYFVNNAVIAKIFETIFLNAHSFWPEKRGVALDEEEYARRYLGPGVGPGIGRRGWTVAAIAIPWLTLIGLALFLFGSLVLAIILWSIAGLTAVAIVLAYCVSRRAGPLDPV